LDEGTIAEGQNLDWVVEEFEADASFDSNSESKQQYVEIEKETR